MTVAGRISSTKSAKNFTHYAYAKMMELFNKHDRQGGRHILASIDSCKTKGVPTKIEVVRSCEMLKPYKENQRRFKGWKKTDCITYVRDVLEYAYEKSGRQDVWLTLNSDHNAADGTPLARRLVKDGWKAYFLKPDTSEPKDRTLFKYLTYSPSMQFYWGVPLSGLIVNYNTPDAKRRDQKARKKIDDELSRVKFGVCIINAGKHTFLFGEGNIYEVHWASLSEQPPTFNDNPKLASFYFQPLYDTSKLVDKPFYEGIVVLPPDSSFSVLQNFQRN